jgi:hypothetical protein
MPPDRGRAGIEACVQELFAEPDDYVLDLARRAVRNLSRRSRPGLDALAPGVSAPQLIEQPDADPVLGTELGDVQPSNINLDDQTANTHRDVPFGHDQQSRPQPEP